MDNNPLTPKKIQRLMYLAEDKSFSSMLRPGNSENNSNKTYPAPQQKISTSHLAPDKSTNNELSSGLLDLERCEAFGDSAIGNLSLSKSTTSFHPGEMTGRSTGTDQSAMLPMSPAPTFSHYGRFSEASIQCLEKKMDQQSSDVLQIMRQSIASGYSFHSKRDLTADEVSLVMREAPVNPNHINMDLKENTQETDPIELSMGSYFQNRCIDFKAMLPGSLDSPSRDYSASMGLSIVEDPPSIQQNHRVQKESHYSMDASLDSVPVRQPRIPKMADMSTATKPKSPNKSTVPRENNPAPMVPPLPFKKNVILMDPSKQHLRSSLHPVAEESGRSEDDSLSISNIRGLLEKESNADIDALMKYMRLVRMSEKQALSNLDMNTEANRQRLEQTQVTLLKDSKRAETASSAGTIETVIHTGKEINQKNFIPEVMVTRYSLSKQDNISVDSDRRESVKTKTRGRSKSPTSSHSTLSTVQENLGCSSFKSSSSPMQPVGVAKTTNISSPNSQYKELDKSVDWQELLQAKGRLVTEGLAKERWAEIKTAEVNGFVGVSTPAVISISSLTDTWLTARLEFNLTEQRSALSIDLPRFPVLLPPGRTEHFTVHITSNSELNESIYFTLYLKDSCIEGEVEMEGRLEVLLRMPTIQAISSDRVNKVTFPPAQEGMILNRSFVLISDCPVDLQLDLTVTEGSNMFTISAVQEIKKADVTKQLLDNQPTVDKQKYKTKGLTKQLCRLSGGNAIKVTLRFSAPKLADLKCGNIAVLNGALEVNLIGINILLKKVDFVATVGTVKLTLEPAGKVNLTHEITTIAVRNEGTITGTWFIRYKDVPESEKNLFKLSESTLEIFPGTTINLKASYQGPDDVFVQRTLTFEEAHSGNKTQLEVITGENSPKVFPIKTSCGKLSWVRNGRKEISLKNFTDKKVHLKCKIVGEWFNLDLVRGGGPNMITQITFAPHERRTLPIVFHTNSTQPATGALYLTVDRDTESRKVFLYGSSSGEALCWSGALVTYGNTALVRALTRQPLELTLTNKSTVPAFLAARVHFNLQYRSVSVNSRLIGSRRVVPARGTVATRLQVDWARVERCAREGAAPSAALATVTVLTGAEVTRRRILKVLKSEGELDLSSLPEHLQQLAGTFEGEDASMDNLLVDFQETKSSLDELVRGIHELTAQIDLPQDFPEDNTILITDDTVMEHHTLAD